MKTKAPSKGFTLIELCVVISLIALISGLALPSLMEAIANKQLTASSENLRSILYTVKSRAIKENQRYTAKSEDGVSIQLLTSPLSGDPVLVATYSVNESAKVSPFSVTFDSLGRLYPFGTISTIKVGTNRSDCSSEIICPSVEVSFLGEVSSCSTTSPC